MLGIDPDRLRPKELQKDRPDDYELWPEHWAAWQVYQRSQTLWRVAVGMGGAWWQGLDYLQVELVMRRIVQVPDEDQPEAWQHLQILEDEARKHLNRPTD